MTSWFSWRSGFAFGAEKSFFLFVLVPVVTCVSVEPQTAVSPSATVLVLASLAGYVASFCFIIQYLPQTMLNYNRKSVRGFSDSGEIIKLIGASFLCVNAILTSEPSSVILYGLCNVCQHLTFMVQFAIYPSDSPPSKSYLLLLLFPLLPLILGIKLPWTITFTSYVKPLTQVLSHLPQIAECVRLSTTLGLSLSTQHLNMLGGCAGLVMCYVIPTSTATLLMYSNSIFQAVSVYGLAIFFSEFFSSRSEAEIAMADTKKSAKDKSDSDISDTTTDPQTNTKGARVSIV